MSWDRWAGTSLPQCGAVGSLRNGMRSHLQGRHQERRVQLPAGQVGGSAQLTPSRPPCHLLPRHKHSQPRGCKRHMLLQQPSHQQDMATGQQLPGCECLRSASVSSPGCPAAWPPAAHTGAAAAWIPAPAPSACFPPRSGRALLRPRCQSLRGSTAHQEARQREAAAARRS